jgi:hypothetical protein
MEHMSRLGAVIACGAFSLACSGGDPTSATPVDPAPAQPGADGSSIDETANGAGDTALDSEWALAFSIEGRTAPMTARAELKVVEGQSAVHIAITGRTSGTDVMMIDLTFDGLENALGPHTVQFSLPEGGAHVANGSLDGNWYYSQGGSIDLSVKPDGEIEGSFDIVLAEGHMSAPGEPIVFESSAETIPLDGEFSGSWVLNCHSRLAGHQTLIVGGDFCEQLEF